MTRIARVKHPSFGEAGAGTRVSANPPLISSPTYG